MILEVYCFLVRITLLWQIRLICHTPGVRTVVMYVMRDLET